MRNSLDLWQRRPSVFSFMNEMDRIFNQMQPTSSPTSEVSKSQNAAWDFQPVSDIHETADGFLISADLPGIKREDITIDVRDGILTFSGERKAEKKVQEGLYSRFEKSYGRFERSFQLSKLVNEEGIEAKFGDGVLEIFIPKKESQKPKKIAIEQKAESFLDRLTGKKSNDSH